MAKNKSPSNILYVLAIFLCALLCAGIGVGAYLTEGFQKPLEIIGETKTFASIDGVELTSSSVLPESEALRIDINGEYSVKVISKEGADFDFTINGELARFSDITDFTKAFNVVRSESYFTLNTTNRTIHSLLLNLYPDSEIELPEDLPNNLTFILSITSANKTLEIELKGIGLKHGITINPSEIVF